MTIISTGECVTSSAVCGLSVNIFLIENQSITRGQTVSKCN